MRLGFVVEGPIDRGALPILTGKVLGQVVEPVFALCQGYPDLRRRLAGFARGLQWQEVRAGIVVADNDGRPRGERRNELESRLPAGLRVPILIGIAVQMVEAWLVAAPDAFEAVYGAPLRLKKLPEEYADPKDEVVVPYLREHTSFLALNEEKAREVAGHADVSQVEQRCPSFREYAVLLRGGHSRAKRPYSSTG